MPQGTAYHFSRVPLDFRALIAALLGRVVLDDLEGLHAVIVSPQLDDIHRLTEGPEVRGELVALLPRCAERVARADRRDAELVEGLHRVGREAPVNVK